MNLEEYRPVYGGQYMVSRSGDVLRYDRWKGEYVEASPSDTGTNGRYKAVYQRVKGERPKRQLTRYVHIMVATAFIPNDDPVNKTFVNHIDADTNNNHASNLEWCTPEHNTRHARDKGLLRTKETRGQPCKMCGCKTLTADGICTDCKARIKHQWAAEQRKQRIAEELANIRSELLSPREREMIQFRRNGAKYAEIGSKYGVSKDRARAIVTACVERCQREEIMRTVFKGEDGLYYPTLRKEIFSRHSSIREFCNKHSLPFNTINDSIKKGVSIRLHIAVKIAEALKVSDIEYLFDLNRLEEAS